MQARKSFMEIEGKFFGYYLGNDDALEALAKTVGKFVNYIGKNTGAKITDVNYADTGEEHMGLGFCLLLDVNGDFETLKSQLGNTFKFGKTCEGVETCGGTDPKYMGKTKSYFAISGYSQNPKFGNFEITSVSLKLFEDGDVE